MKKIITFLAAAILAVPAFSEAGKITLTDKSGKEKTFNTISDALKAAKNESRIVLPKGTYNEVLYYNGTASITISGDTDAAFGSDVIIAIDNNSDMKKISAASNALKGRCVFEFEGSGNLTLENLTIKNTFDRANSTGKGTQAEALGFDSTGNLAAYNCSFLSHQDTLRTTGKAWFYKCYIEGDTDFIWMERDGKVALYEECEIKSIYDENLSNHTSYICAPRMEMMPVISKGIVILNSNITCDENQKTYLARTPWKEGYYNQVAYIGCKLSGISSEVWYKEPLMSKKTPRVVLGWKMDKKTAESMGLNPEGRNDVMKDELAENEYNGRNAILNRVVSVSKSAFKKDGKIWDTASLALKNGWNVSEDSSSALHNFVYSEK